MLKCTNAYCPIWLHCNWRSVGTGPNGSGGGAAITKVSIIKTNNGIKNSRINFSVMPGTVHINFPKQFKY